MSYNRIRVLVIVAAVAIPALYGFSFGTRACPRPMAYAAPYNPDTSAYEPAAMLVPAVFVQQAEAPEPPEPPDAPDMDNDDNDNATGDCPSHFNVTFGEEHTFSSQEQRTLPRGSVN